MKKLLSIPTLSLLLLLAAFGLWGCSTSPETSAAASQAEQPAEVEMAAAPTVPETATATETDTETSPETPAAVAAETTDYCIDCHTDQQALIDTASPEEPLESENEGEG